MIDIIPTPKKNLIFDASVFTMIMSCARLTDFTHNLNLQPISGKSNSLEAGSIMHKILEVYYNHLMKGFDRKLAIENGLTAGLTYATGCKYCTDFTPTPEQPTPSCKHKPDEYPGVRNTPPESTNKPYQITGYNHVLKTAEEYFEYYKNDHWVTLEVENVRRKILYEDDEMRILWKAKLDRLCDTNQGIYPVDTKTMKQRRDTISLNNQFMGQCLLTDSRSVIIDKVGFQTSLKPEEKFTRPMVNYTSDRLMEWQSQILPYWANMYLIYIETGYWPPNFNHCESKWGYCIFKDVCEADRGMREEELKLNFVVGKPWDPDND